MNEQDRSELERLMQEHGRLERELSDLRVQLRRLESRVHRSQSVSPFPVAQSAPPAPELPAAEPFPALKPAAAVPPPIPPIASTPNAEPQPAIAHLSARLSPVGGDALLRSPRPAPGAGPGPARKPDPVEPTAGSLELRLGTYWLVRVGIVMLLTALVFFGNYAYQNFIGKLGPVGKVALMYAGGLLLLGAGAWWQRRAVKETLRNYAQVLLAGGMAAVYFTTYAAHHFPNLRVIESATLDGTLLLAWAGFMVFMADRLKSEVLALFAVGLAYYSSIITRVGHFTLYSNLVLAVAAIFFLVRNRWAVLSFASVAATYFGYSFWRFFQGTSWQWATPDQGLWSGVYFLGAYWLIFTAAIFLSRDERFAGSTRTSFLTINNASFFALFFLTMLQVEAGGLWKFLIGYGTVLIGLAVAARQVLPQEPLTRNAYLAQGLLLVTVGFITKFSGLHLALLLGAESVILLYLGQLQRNLVLQTGAYLSALLAVGWGIDGLQEFDRAGLYLGAGLGAMMIANALMAHRHTEQDQALVRFQPGWFTGLALIAWLAVTWNNSERADLAHLLALEAGLLTLSVYLLRVREIALFGQLLVFLAHLAWLANVLAQGQPAWWQAFFAGGVTLGLTHWWQHEQAIPASRQARFAWQWAYSLLLLLLLYTWLQPQFEPAPWLGLTSLLCILLTAYAVATRAWIVAASAQVFLLISTLEFARQLASVRPSWWMALAPVTALALLSYSTMRWFRVRPGNHPRLRAGLLQTAMVYRWVALGMVIAWVWVYIPEAERIWVLGLLGTAAFAWAGLYRQEEGLLFSAVFTGTALAWFWTRLVAPTVYWANLAVIVALLVQQQVAARLPDRFRISAQVQNAVIAIGALTLWLFVSRFLHDAARGFFLTASWSVLALLLFGCGIARRERMYRWVGLGILACALGRVVLFDVWKLETLYRMLSFFALGIVLLVLGFVYSKYQEKIRQWL